MDCGSPLAGCGGGGGGGSTWSSPSYGDTQLGRAMQICDRHRLPPTMMTVPPQGPMWNEAWAACNTVFREWQNSETVRKQKEYEAQVERDRQFVIKLEKELKP